MSNEVDIRKPTRLMVAIGIRRSLRTGQHHAMICGKVARDIRDLLRGVRQLRILVPAINRVADQQHAPVRIALLPLAVHREQPKRLGVRDRDILNPEVRTLRSRKQRLKVEAAQSLITDDEDPATLRNHPLHRLDQRLDTARAREHSAAPAHPSKPESPSYAHGSEEESSRSLAVHKTAAGQE